MNAHNESVGESVRCPRCGGLSDEIANEDGDLTCSFCRARMENESRERARVRRGRLRILEDFEREMRRELASQDIRYERDSMEPDSGPDA